MLRSLWKGAERRRFPRIDAQLDVEIAVEVYGFHGEVHPFFASGRTLNVARAGVLALLDAPVPAGAVAVLSHVACAVTDFNTGNSITHGDSMRHCASTNDQATRCACGARVRVAHNVR